MRSGLTLVLAATMLGAAVPGRTVVDNERVTVRDLSWAKGALARTGSLRDMVVISLASGNAGAVAFVKAGTAAAIDTTPADADMRAIVVELKDRSGHYRRVEVASTSQSMVNGSLNVRPAR